MAARIDDLLVLGQNISKTDLAKYLRDREAVLPFDFGGLGDGAANDRAAIQACFDRAAADKKFAVIPPGNRGRKPLRKRTRTVQTNRASSFQRNAPLAALQTRTGPLAPCTRIMIWWTVLAWKTIITPENDSSPLAPWLPIRHGQGAGPW